MNEEGEIEYKSVYTWIFSVNHLQQGLVSSIYSVIIPIYILLLIEEGGLSITPSDIAYIASIITIPWAIKLFFGIVADKFGLKNYGRRRPWIFGALLIATVMWMLMPVFISPVNIIMIVIITGVIINTGVAFSDTALDGFIIDICPKERLGRVQGFVWGLRSIGIIAGGPVLAALVVFGHLSVQLIFVLQGILTLISAFSILIVREPKDYPEARIKQHFKGLFNTKRDWITYTFAFFNNMIGDVMVLFLSLFILLEMGLVELKGRNLSLGIKTLDIYMFQANITLIIAIGIVIGSIVGGQIADKKTRKYATYAGCLLTTVSLLLMLIPTHWTILLFFTVIIGLALGWRHSAYSAVVGQYAKKHPEMDSTYLSVANSFTNFGATVGLLITGLIFELFFSYMMLFIILAILSNLTIIPFLFMNIADYEHSFDKKEMILDLK